MVAADSVAASRYMFPTGSVVMNMHAVISDQTLSGRTSMTRDGHLHRPGHVSLTRD
jgi:hypothetical protein